MRLLFLLMLIIVWPAAAEEPLPSLLTIEEWKVPWGGRPRDPYVDSQGKVWFCGQAGNYIAYLNPASNDFKRYELDENTHPHNLIIDQLDQVWYAGNTNTHIGKLNATTGSIDVFPMTLPALKDPHTLVFNQKGDIWFTAQWGNAIGYLSVETGNVKQSKIPTLKARPYGIKMDTQGHPWIVLLGTHKLATVNPETFLTEEIPLPRKDSRPRRLEITKDGNIWYVDYQGGHLGRYNPNNAQITEWLLPGGKASKPYGTALDKQQRLWIAETGSSPNRLVGFDTRKAQFISTTDVPSGGSIRHMYYHQATEDIWFGVDTGYISRAYLGE